MSPIGLFSDGLTAYQGGTLVDVTGGPSRPDMTVVVDGGKFVAVGTNAEITPGRGARAVDVAGRYVIPGLVDSHQHIATPPDRAAAEAVLRRLVYSGVTVIRSMADDLRQVVLLLAGVGSGGRAR